MMEIGSFLELHLNQGMEYYKGQENTARLNSGRAAIFHAIKVLGCNTVWLPFYQCDTVRDFLSKKDINIKYYHIDKAFNPIDLNKAEEEAVVFVNYYGIMSDRRMKSLAGEYGNVIIDDSQAFFAKPIKNAMNVYSARKFIGVPDGAYVVGENAGKDSDDYNKCFSSDTALFLLQRIEYGCEGKTYESRSVNEARIDGEDVMQMSGLTRAILDGTDYEFIKNKRRENFEIASELFSNINKINPNQYYDETCIPMVYPLVVEDDKLLQKLLDNKHFQGHWWSYLLSEMGENDFEYWLSRYIIPITIDQRYGSEEIKHVRGIVE
ncbi:MAG: hypothetical protein RR177_02805 [Oscillospiraceae bacterium]